MFFSTLFTLFGLGALCWILFNLAVYALPFAIGLTSGMYLRSSTVNVTGAKPRAKLLGEGASY